LIGCIKDQETEFGSSCFSILSCFIPPENKDKEFDSRMRLFNKKQFELIKRFLHYLIAIGDQDESAIQKAMNYVVDKINEA
jgi:hypothetical protein